MVYLLPHILVFDQLYIMIKLYEFRTIPSSERIDICLEEGTFLAERQDKKHYFALYTYENEYFIELVVCKLSETFIRATPLPELSAKKLDLYLDNISIGDLFN